jgi:hypothetical protein
MRHLYLDCKDYVSGEIGAIAECDYCRKSWENEKSYCSHCWQLVSNAAFFGKKGKSKHLDGTCSERAEMPASFVARKSTAARSVDPLSSYWASSKDAAENQAKYEASCAEAKSRQRLSREFHKQRKEKLIRATQAPSPVVVVETVDVKPEPIQAPVVDPLAERLAKLLEEQNELLRQLAKKAA